MQLGPVKTHGRTQNVVIDVDTGVDDALALLFAVRHPGLRVHAITCVAGNAAVEQVVRNTLTVLEHADAPPIPVAAGAARPLIAPPHDASHVHGRDGMADLGLPPSPRKPDPRHAVELLRDVLRDAAEPVTLIALAPLTNIALLARTYPEAMQRLERIVVMGGTASTGNATPVAEFNAWHDPEAAAIVFAAGVPVTMYGLDVFYRVGVAAAGCDKLAAHEHRSARLAGQLLRHQLRTAAGEARTELGMATIGDAGAVCAVADPAGLVTAHLPVQVELAPGFGRGQTVVDRRARSGEQELHGMAAPAARLDVAIDVDAARYGDLFLSTILGEPGTS
ncbi:nucleoside hydrolase [Amycolatopsis jejuensis]|uniref:nucleoside hydrolase n=1 Tax=Amycolatopsis jejuensis TaxID=330084 RepID=UPI00068F49D5|nr:nucleoside hydrolase [Amycolatopsis jejuensis]